MPIQDAGVVGNGLLAMPQHCLHLAHGPFLLSSKWGRVFFHMNIFIHLEELYPGDYHTKK